MESMKRDGVRDPTRKSIDASQRQAARQLVASPISFLEINPHARQ